MGHFWWPLGPPQVTAHSQADSSAGRVSNAGYGLWLHQPGCQWLNYLFSNCKHLLLGLSVVHFLVQSYLAVLKVDSQSRCLGKALGFAGTDQVSTASVSSPVMEGSTIGAYGKDYGELSGLKGGGSMGSAIGLLKTNTQPFPTQALGLRFEVSVSSSAKWG